jgi:plastocyanin
MFVSTKTLIACFAPLALAQYGPPAGGGGSSSSTAPPQASTTAPTSPSTTASANPGVQTIVVGANNALTFNPNSTTAAVGTTVEFQFPGALVHSVVEGSFANPCVPANGSAFFSGGLSSASPNVFTLTINDTNPIVSNAKQY